MEDKFFSKNISQSGFQKLTVCDDMKQIYCDVYVRSPIRALQSQIRGSSSDSTFFNFKSHPENTRSFCHPMMAALGREGERTVRNEVMSCCEDRIMWHNDANSTEKSFAGMVQFYSDKSQTSLKESSFQFYPFHATLLNFSEEYRRQCIVNGMTTVAFLPTKFYSIENSCKTEINLARTSKLQVLHRCISTILQELMESALAGFICVDLDGKARRCHSCIASYCCDIPESKDILPVRNGNSGERNCHRCTAETKDFYRYTNNVRRTGNSTLSLLLEAKRLRKLGNNKKAEEILKKHSLAEFVPSLLDFPFMGKHSVLDIHSIFGFEPLHNLHLGISKLLKTCMSERLKSISLKTSNVPTRAGSTRNVTFRTVRMRILTGVNKMLSHVQRYNPAKGLKIDFSKGGAPGHEKGLYGGDGNLIGMLEGNDYRNIDMVFPFTGMFVDRFCDEVHSAVSTNLFVLYVEIMRKVLSYNSDLDMTWNEESIKKLEQKISIFKRKAMHLYSDFQPSGMCTEKMHLLDHIGEDIRRLGGLRCCDASLYEYSHTVVKSAHKSSSKRKHSEMEETLSNYMKRIGNGTSYDSDQYICVPEPSKRSVSRSQGIICAQAEANRDDCATLVKRGHNFSLRELDHTRRLCRRLRIAQECGDDQQVSRIKKDLMLMDTAVLQIVEGLGEAESRVLYRELSELTKNRSGNVERHQGMKQIIRVSSGFVAGVPAPSKDDYDDSQLQVSMKETSLRIPQRFVSEKGFYNNPILRQDCVMLEAQGESTSGQKLAWFGKVLGLFRIAHENNSAPTSEEQMAFVQFFDVNPLKDEVERALGCVKLVWARGDHCEGEEDEYQDESNEKERKWFSLVPVASIRAVIHVLRGDYGISNRSLGVDMENVPWYQQHFYVNRFFYDRSAKFFKR